MNNIKIDNSGAITGLGFFGLLTIILVSLKLLGHISISWLWVFSPIIFVTTIYLLIILATFLLIFWLK